MLPATNNIFDDYQFQEPYNIDDLPSMNENYFKNLNEDILDENEDEEDNDDDRDDYFNDEVEPRLYFTNDEPYIVNFQLSLKLFHK